MTLATAEACGFPMDRIMFELTEDERSRDLAHLTGIFHEYARRGFLTAIDDFGAGFAGFELLAAFQPDVLKIDMQLVRDIDTIRVRHVIVDRLVDICRTLGILVIAEGVETTREFEVLRGFGVELFQGYLFARPALAALPAVDWSACTPPSRLLSKI